MTHAHTVTVPGAAAAWADAVRAWGRMPLAKVLEPAARLADEGVPIAPVTAHAWDRQTPLLRERASAEMLIREGLEFDSDADGDFEDRADESRAAAVPVGDRCLRADRFRAPRCGEVFRNPGLARTLRRLGALGARAGFYTGDVAEAIVEAVRARGGVMSLDDLASHHSEFVRPISTVYRGARVWECPPNGQGLAALLALNILQAAEPDSAAFATRSPADRAHVMIECMRLAFADCRWYIADPRHAEVPVENMLRPEYAASRAALIDRTRAAADVATGAPIASSDTVSFQVVDAEGNACAFINSNYAGFGSGAPAAGWLSPTRSNALAIMLGRHLPPWMGLHPPEPRRQLFTTTRPPKCARSWQATLSHHHPRNDYHRRPGSSCHRPHPHISSRLQFAN